MRSFCLIAVLALAVPLIPSGGAFSYDCPYSLEVTTRVTCTSGRSQTARDNARCICIDPGGTTHMVWEDERHGNFEIYYASMVGDSVLPAVRITQTMGESTHPCVACDSQNVYVLWNETTGTVTDIHYVRLTGGIVAARKQITRSLINATRPVSVAGPNGVLHIAWHEGPLKQTAIYYGIIVDDSLLVRQPICTEHPEAFRPDIARDSQGNILLTWFEGLLIKSKLWDGAAWGEEMLVTTNESRPWRLSVAGLGDGKWALAWFDKTKTGSDVRVKFFDGKEWYGETTINSAQTAYYPSLIALGGGNLAVVWENNIGGGEEYTIELRCYNGTDWSTPIDIYSEGVAGRYPSLANEDDRLHAVWFSGKASSNEIYHGLLRRKR
ncbi:MAG: sialidase family protein [Candidatus Eisenbacteria bacterium]